MAPTTPRTTNSTYGSTATPRSARRLTTLGLSGTPSRVPLNPPPELPPLVPLNTKKFPQTPYADDPEFNEMLQQDMENVDTAIELLSRSTEQTRTQLREHLTHLESERTSYENRIRELGELAKEMVRNQQKERIELEQGKNNEGEVNRQHQKLKVKLEGYQQEVREALTKLQHRREFKSRQVEAFSAQIAKNKPELDFFEQSLSMKMRAKANDTVQFKFVNLDRTSYSRTFSFDLDVSTPTYILSSLSPPNYLPAKTTTNLLHDLNSRKLTLYDFIREMRYEFCLEIEVEKRLGPSSSSTTTRNPGVEGGGEGGVEEGRREREREKIRSEAEGNGR